jgi:hypothetical protein
MVFTPFENTWRSLRAQLRGYYETAMYYDGKSSFCALILIGSAVAIDGIAIVGQLGNGGYVDINKLNHIFSKSDHRLDPFLSSYGGNQMAAYADIEKAVQQYVVQNNLTGRFQHVNINIHGHNIGANGIVVDGIAKIGTAFSLD